MDYDDNDAQEQNLHLGGEGSSKVSPVLHPYTLPKFDFDDNLQGHLRFDSLVENEVFLGITNQEDHQWIEEYSRGTNAIQFSSSAAELRHKNVWSEATSSESVEMLLKSVGQEEGVVKEVVEESDACDRPDSSTNVMDPNLKQCDEKGHLINTPNAILADVVQENVICADSEQPHAIITSHTQETQISGEELDSVVIGDKHGLSFGEEKCDKICDDANQEGSDLENDSVVNKLQQDYSASKVECGNAGTSQNVDPSIEACQENPQEVSEMCIENASGPPNNVHSSETEQIIKNKENSMDHPTNSGASIEISTYSVERLSVVTNVESLDKPLVGGSMGPAGSLPIGSCDIHEKPFVVFTSSGCVKIVETEDANTQSEVPNAPKSDVGSPSSLSLVQSHSVEEPKNGVGSDDQHVTLSASKVSLGDDNLFEMGEGSNINTVNRASPAASSSAEMATEDISNEGVAAANDCPNIDVGGSNDDNWNLPGETSGLVQVGDETHSSDKVVTFKERGDARLPLDSKDIDMDVGGAPYSQKYVGPSSSGEGCEDVIPMDQESESNMAVLTTAVASMESSKIPSSGMLDSVQFMSGTVATADMVTNSQPRSPILGVSLLHGDEEEKVEVGLSSERSFQKRTLAVDSTVDCALDGPLPVVKMDAASDGAEKAVHICDTLAGNCNASPSEQTPDDYSGGLKCSKTLETNTLPCDSSAEGGSNGESGGLLDAKESMTGEEQVEPLNLAVNMLDEQQASAGPSESDANPVLQNKSDSASLDKPQFFSFSDIKSIEPSQSAEDKHEVTKGPMHENSPLSKVSNDGEELHLASRSSATKEGKNFTFEVSASAGSGHTSIQNLSLSKNMKVSSISSSDGILDPNKLHEDSLVSPQTPSSAAIETGVKGNPKRKPRRKSVGRETAKKGDPLKGTTPPIRSGRVKKLPALLTSPATGHVKPLEELKPKNPEGSLPIPMSNLPNPTNSTSIFQKSFTDDQQLQLRAQILVYGSLISGMPPEELHMIAAFGQSDDGRRAWEAAWHASLERIRGHKSQASNPGTPMQSRPDVGNRYSDQGIKIGSAQSKVISTPTTGPSHACISSPVVTSMLPISSPLWNISTPCAGLQSSAVPRSPLLDYRQTLSPLPLYQTPQGQSFGGLNSSWPSQGHFPGQWLASSPIVSFGAHFSSLPITEAVKLTTVKESGAPDISVIPVDRSAGPSVSLGPSSLSNVRKPTSSGQRSSDSKSRKRKNVSASVVVSQMVPSQAQVPSSSAPVPHLPWAPHTECHDQTSFLPKIQTNSGTTPVVNSHSPTSTASLIPINITSKSHSGSFLSAISPASTHGHPILGDQNLEKIVARDEMVSKILDSKLQAADAAVHAASAVSHCQGVWNQLEKQRSSGLVSNDEVNLVYSAASIAAAASVAKVAAAAAKIATNVAEQARLMANEVFQSSRTETYDQSSMISRANVISNFDKATPASILDSADGSDHPTSIISAAREAAHRKIKAASAASKHAENLDAIVKAAELAAEAVSQAGKLIAMSSPLPSKESAEAGPEGYLKTLQSSNQQRNSGKQNVEAVSNDKEIHNLKHGLSLQENSRDLAKNQMLGDGMSGSYTNFGNDISTARARKSPDSSKTIGVIPESEFESIHTSDVNRNMPQDTSDTWKDNNFKEGCLVEVCKDDNKNKRAWFAAKVLTLKDGKAFVCYNEIQSDEGSGQLKEWIPLEVGGTEPPRIRIARPMTTMQSEGTRKRGRKALTDYDWCSGDRVDVWVQDSWCEATVLETNKIDVTSLTVQFPAEGEKSVVRSWHVRPSLIWKDGKWIEWSNVKGSRSSEGDTPHEKRRKFGRHGVEVTDKDKSLNIDLAESGKLQESSIFPLSAQGSSFDVGKSSGDEKLRTSRKIRSGSQKERSGVVIGVPRPGKKQKFMDVSKHYVANGSNKKNTPHDSVKLASYSMPQAPGHRGLKNNSKNDTKEEGVAEKKSKLLKSSKPPIPSTLVQKDKPKSLKHVPDDASMNDKTVKDSVGVDENVSDTQDRISSKEDAIEGPSSSTLPSDIQKETKTSKAISQRLNNKKFVTAEGKSTEVEVKDKPNSEAEPRRSNRRIQPTSRLLEGLQTSLTMTKVSTGSHASQRSHNKVTSKGSSNPGRVDV